MPLAKECVLRVRDLTPRLKLRVATPKQHSLTEKPARSRTRNTDWVKNRTTSDRLGNQVWNQGQTSGLPCEARATEGQLDVPQCDEKLAAGLDENWCFLRQ